MGSTGADEMCNFYMMFWVQGDMPKDIQRECWASGSEYDNWATKSALKSNKNAPLEISEQPPLGTEEEEVVRDDPEKVDSRDALGRGTLSEDDPEFVLNTEDGGRFYMDKEVYNAIGFR